MSPTRILSRHSDGQVRDELHDPASSRRSSLVCPVLGNELSVPTKDRVGSDEGTNLGESPSSNRLAPNGESATLVGRAWLPGEQGGPSPVALHAGSLFDLEFGGTQPGTDDTNHDQLDASGSVTIGRTSICSLSSGRKRNRCAVFPA